MSTECWTSQSSHRDTFFSIHINIIINIIILFIYLFSGGLVFGINAVGRRTGEAVVVLENEEQAILALQRDRHYMEKRYIEVRIRLIVFITVTQIYCQNLQSFNYWFSTIYQ